MYPVLHTVTVTTASDGSATAYTTSPVQGRLFSIRYVKTNFADNSTITITGNTTGQTLWSESNVNSSAERAPRQPTHASDGSASLYADSGEPVEDYYVLNETVKIVIASGGDTKTGTFHFMVG